MSQEIYSENLQLSLDTFAQRMYLLDKADNPQLIAKIVLKWTKGQPLLTKKLLQHLLHLDKKIVKGKELFAVEKAIRNGLLKEFKHDKLTLKIRLSVYRKDLESILEKSDYSLNRNTEIHLTNLQRKLGLSDRECRSIKNEYSIFNYDRSGLDDGSPEPEGLGDRQLWMAEDSVFNSDDSSFLSPEHPSPSSQIFLKRWFYLLASIPLLLLGIKIVLPIANSTSNLSKHANFQQQKLCVDLSTRRSSRMSLGEKLLTKDYSHLNPASSNALYEGMAAFARCEFSAARRKFRQSITLNKNNPEALIYYNNSQAIAQKHLKIAVSLPLGNKPDIAWEILRGVAQAQSEINQQGGIKNKQLLIQIVSDDNDPNIVKQVARQLVADRKILAVVGHNDSNSSLVASNIYQQHKLVAISPTSTSTKLSGVGSYILRTIPSVSALARELADYASLQSFSKIAICFDPLDSASNSFIQEFKFQTKENGGDIVKVGCDFSEGNYQANSLVGQAIAQEADAILVAPSVNNIEQAIEIARVNRQRLPLLGNHSLNTAETIQLGQKAIAGMVVPAPWLYESAANTDFIRETKQYWGGRVNWRTAMAYDATGAIIQGLQSSGTRSKLQSTLTQAEFRVDGATGTFHFEQGDRFGKVYLASVEPSSRKSFQYKFSHLETEDENEIFLP